MAEMMENGIDRPIRIDAEPVGRARRLPTRIRPVDTGVVEPSSGLPDTEGRADEVAAEDTPVKAEVDLPAQVVIRDGRSGNAKGSLPPKFDLA